MDSTAQYSVLHDDFLKASESGKVAKDPATMYHPTTAGKQGVTTAVLIKNAVFRTMSEVLVPTAPSKSMWMLQFLIVWAQTLSFVLSDSSELLWSATVLNSFTNVLSMLSLRNIESAAIEEVAVYAAIGLVCLVLGTFVWVGAGLLAERPIPPWIIKVLRTVSQSCGSLLFIPVLTNLLRPLRCDENWYNGSRCGTSLHLALTIASVTLATVFTACVILMNTCCIDRDPNSESHAAAPHGRVAGFFIFVQAILVVVYSLDAVLHTTFIVTITCIASASLTYAFMKYLPFYKLSVAKAYSFASLIMCWASFCLVLLQCRNQPKNNVEAFLLLLGAPSSGYVGSGVAEWWFTHCNTTAHTVLSAFNAELALRFILSKLRQDDHDSSSGGGGKVGNSLDANAVLKAAEMMLAKVLRVQEGSPFLHVFVAQYVQAFRKNRHVELLHITRAENLKPPLDVEYFVYQRRAQIRMHDTYAVSTSAQARAKLETLRIRSDELCVVARERLVDFWTEMLKPVPSLARLNKFGSEIETTIRECDDCFQKQLAVSSTSIQTLRRYAQFLQDICNNPMKALRVTSQADDLEDASARDHKEASIAVTLFHPSSALDATREDLGIITVGQSTSNMGVILSANVTALKMYGYSKRDLIGQSLNIIIPEPVASVHQLYMRNYVRTGREVMMNSSRTMFGKHKQGYLFPLLINSISGENGFVGMMQRLHTSDEFIWFYSKSLVIAGATQDCMRALGRDPNDIEEGRVNLSTFVDESKVREMITLHRRVSGGDDIQRIKNNTSLIPVEFKNLSPEYMISRGLGSGKGQVFPSIEIMARVQITPFLRTGWVIGHLHEDGSAVAETADDERLVLMTWSRSASLMALDSQEDEGTTTAADIILRGFSQRCISQDLASKPRTPKIATASHSSCDVGDDVVDNLDDAMSQTSNALAGVSETSVPLPVKKLSKQSTKKTLTFEDQEPAGGSSPQCSVHSDAPAHSQTSKVMPVDTAPQREGSVASSFNSRGSKSTISAFHNALERGQAHEESSLVLLRRLIIIVAMATVGISLATMSISKTAISNGVRSATMLYIGGDRLMAQQSAVFWTELLVANSAGADTRLNYNDTKEMLAKNLDIFTKMHYILISGHVPTYPPQVYITYDQLFPISRMVAGEPVVSHQTFMDMIAEYITVGGNILYLAPVNATLNQSDVWHLMRNNGPVQYTLNMSITYRYVSNAEIFEKNNILDTLNSASLIMLAAQVAMVIIPIAIMVERQRHRIYGLFMFVPQPILKRMQRQAVKGLESLMNQLQNVNELDSLEGGGSEDESVARGTEKEQSIDWNDIRFKNVKSRNVAKEYSWIVRLVLLLSLPLASCMVYVHFMNGYSAEEKAAVIGDHTSMFISEQRGAHVMSAMRHAAMALNTNNSFDVEYAIAESNSQLDLLIEKEAIMYASPESGFRNSLSNGDLEKALMLSDGCYGASNVTDCKQVLNGVFGKGLHAVVQYFVSSLREALVTRVKTGSSLTVKARFEEQKWKDVELMAFYLMDGLKTANSLRKDSILAGQSRYIQTLDIAQACFIMGVIVSYFVLFVPVIRALNTMLKHARQTLLLLPDEAVMGVVQIRTLMKEYAKTCK